MRLIDAEAFDVRVRVAGGMSEEELTDDFKDGVLAVLELLKTQPTADIPEPYKMPMSRLDDAIASVAYILDALRAYRSIVESGDCNNCKDRVDCPYSPGCGRLVRYNCPFYRRSGEQHGVQDH